MPTHRFRELAQPVRTFFRSDVSLTSDPLSAQHQIEQTL